VIKINTGFTLGLELARILKCLLASRIELDATEKFNRKANNEEKNNMLMNRSRRKTRMLHQV
jgi:hypothetical protein